MNFIGKQCYRLAKTIAARAARLPSGLRVVIATGMMFLITACSNDQFEDLEGYVNQVKGRPGKPISPLPKVTPYERYSYNSKKLRDPFVPAKKARAKKGGSSNKLRPNMVREKEVLEQYPLDTLKMVGSLKQGAEKWAIIKTTDGMIHRVKVGNYLGKNFGKILRITDTQIELKEILADGLGGWMQRQAALKITD